MSPPWWTWAPPAASSAAPPPRSTATRCIRPPQQLRIGLASAPRPEGPWTPYAHNPILRLQQFPGLNDHLSSPELVLRPDHPNAPFWLYVHGRTGPRAEGFGQHTCVATSRDAVAWDPLRPDPVLTATAGQSGHKNSAAYARLFQRHGWQYALYKAETVHSLARSQDGLAWEHWPHNPLLAPDPGAGDRNMIRHTGLLLRGDTLLIFYSSVPDRDDPHGREEIKLATLDVSRADWLGWGGLGAGAGCSLRSRSGKRATCAIPSPWCRGTPCTSTTLAGTSANRPRLGPTRCAERSRTVTTRRSRRSRRHVLVLAGGTAVSAVSRGPSPRAGGAARQSGTTGDASGEPVKVSLISRPSEEETFKQRTDRFNERSPRSCWSTSPSPATTSR